MERSICSFMPSMDAEEYTLNQNSKSSRLALIKMLHGKILIFYYDLLFLKISRVLLVWAYRSWYRDIFKIFLWIPWIFRKKSYVLRSRTKMKNTLPSGMYEILIIPWRELSYWSKMRVRNVMWYNNQYHIKRWFEL